MTNNDKEKKTKKEIKVEENDNAKKYSGLTKPSQQREYPKDKSSSTEN